VELLFASFDLAAFYVMPKHYIIAVLNHERPAASQAV